MEARRAMEGNLDSVGEGSPKFVDKGLIDDDDVMRTGQVFLDDEVEA